MHAGAAEVAAVVTPASAMVEAVDERTCLLYTGSDSLDALAVWVSLLGFDFHVNEPPELVEHLRAMAGRLGHATRGPQDCEGPAR